MTDQLLDVAEAATLFRALLTADMERISASEMVGRFVPYDVVALVADDTPDGLDIYSEGFRSSAFTRQLSDKGNQKRVGLVHAHRGGLGYVGHSLQVRSEPDGLYGVMSVLPTKRDDISALVDAGIDELSMEFRLPPQKRTGVPNTVVEDGVRWRVNAHLDNIALEAKGAYTGAKVLQMRSEIAEIQQQRADLAEQEAEVAAAKAKIAAEQAADAEASKARKAQWDELVARTNAEEQRGAEYRKRFGVT